VTPGYFEALGIPIKLGRSFTDADRDPGELPIILSERLWRSEFGQADPIGSRTGKKWPRVVVGVAGDVRNNGLANDPDPEYYVVRKNSREGVPGDSDPSWWRRGTAVVRTTLSYEAASALLKSAIRELDATLPVQVRSMDTEVDRYLIRPRFQTVLLGVFALAGLVLAGIGLYGLISFLVAARTREIGVRIALGATPVAIIKMVVFEAGPWISAGVVIGTVAAAVSSRLLETMLYEIESLDIRAFLGAIAALVTVALLASWIPARRACNIEPNVALREE
jgi:putative ABC transport system permease protein